VLVSNKEKCIHLLQGKKHYKDYLLFWKSNEAVQFINQRPKPLVLYLFSKDNKKAEQVVKQTSSGSMCVNHAMIQLSMSALPFAVSACAYHGKASFDIFSHRKAVLKRAQWFDLRFMYSPYRSFFKKLVR
jgi:aldehyde dehydrogenase (NAD+)